MKIIVSELAAEARIKRKLKEENKKLKKKGGLYIVMGLEKGGANQVFNSLTELVNSFAILDEWEEIEAENRTAEFVGDVSMSEVAHVAAHAALTAVVSKLGTIGIIGDIQGDNELAEDVIDRKVYEVVLEALKEIKKAGAHPKTINLID